MRLHELAKELEVPSKELLALAKELGLGVRSHSSALEPGQIALLRAAQKQRAKSEEEAPAEEEPKKKVRRRRRRRVSEEAETAAAQETPPESSPEEAAVESPPAEAPAPEQETGPPAGVEKVEEGVEGAEAVAASAEGSAAVTDETAAERAAEDEAAGAKETREEPATEKTPAEEPAVTPRRRTGAKILGRIELPKEEIERARDRTAGLPPSQDLQEVGTSAPGHHGRGRSGLAEREYEARKRPSLRPKEEEPAWSPEDEDDPLLQGIRIRHVQAGPTHRRPPRRVGPRRSQRGAQSAPARTGPFDVTVPISVKDFSRIIGVPVREIRRILSKHGRETGADDQLSEELVLEVAVDLDLEVRTTVRQTREETFLEELDEVERKIADEAKSDPSRMKPRPPVVAFLGHVDHGKTSLLDFIRKTNVAAEEAGGITQSMRAYSVTAPNGQRITFLDTPGHKAFTEMRARGAHVTDIVVLVVAADDGVMPQTEEAIQHAKAAGTPIVVALNKIDRPEARPERVLQQLASLGVQAEDWGGDVLVAQTSAVTGAGIDDLLEKILLQAELMELKADPTRPAFGYVLEAKKDERLGPVATVLVKEGTLHRQDIVLAGTAYGRVRTLIDDRGRRIDEAGPSMPVNVVGLNECPPASEKFVVVKDLRTAREVAEERAERARKQKESGAPSPAAAVTLENLQEMLKGGQVKELNVVLRADVQGSLEVLRRELQQLKTDEVRVRIIRDALGAISEDDIVLAQASKAVVLGFNVIPDEKARRKAEEIGIDVRTYQVIYELIDDVKKALEGLLPPERKEEVLGHAEVRRVFKVSKVGTIAGCYVTDGVARRNAQVRLTRDGRVLFTGQLESLKRFKDDVREVREGFECGLKIHNYDDVKEGDVIEFFEVKEVRRELEFEEEAGA